MIRRLLIAASVLSLLLCAASVAVWVRSYHVSDICSCKRTLGTAGNRQSSANTGWEALASTSNGRIWAEWRSASAALGAAETPCVPPRPAEWTWDHTAPGTYWWVERKIVPGWHGLSYTSGATTLGGMPILFVQRTLLLPLSWLSIAFAVLPAMFLLRTFRPRRARARQGICPACGYSLQGNVSRVCPECGTPAPPNWERLPGP